jgi:hypothetical protein
VFTDHTSIEAVLAGACGQGVGQGDPILVTFASAHQAANLGLRRASQGHGKGAVGEAADGLV